MSSKAFLALFSMLNFNKTWLLNSNMNEFWILNVTDLLEVWYIHITSI